MRWARAASPCRAAATIAFEAGDHPLASAAAADEVGNPVESALSRSLAGGALAKCRERAVVELEKAGDALHTCGASRYRAAAELELRQLGRRISRAPCALFVSPKTVETHPRHIFQKLGVTSRVEVARTLEAVQPPDLPGSHRGRHMRQS